jgi:hypothetical protein
VADANDLWADVDAVGDAPLRDGSVEISTDPSRVDRHLIHSFLCDESYWARGIPVETVAAEGRYRR